MSVVALSGTTCRHNKKLLSHSIIALLAGIIATFIHKQLVLGLDQLVFGWKAENVDVDVIFHDLVSV